MKHIPNRDSEEMSQEEIVERKVAGEWWDAMTLEARREAFIGLVVIHEHEVLGHIKECIKKSLGLSKEKRVKSKNTDIL